MNCDRSNVQHLIQVERTLHELWAQRVILLQGVNRSACAIHQEALRQQPKAPPQAQKSREGFLRQIHIAGQALHACIQAGRAETRCCLSQASHITGSGVLQHFLDMLQALSLCMRACIVLAIPHVMAVSTKHTHMQHPLHLVPGAVHCITRPACA